MFVLIGATAATYGPTIPSLRSTFHISAATAGLLLSGHFAGSLVGTLGPSFLPRRYRSPRVVVGVSIVALSAGCMCIGVARVWPMALGGATVEGLGWGGLVIAFNALFAAGFGTRSPAMLTFLNAIYGVGAILGPAGVGLLAGGEFRGPFLVAGSAALALLPTMALLPSDEVTGQEQAGDATHVTRLPVLLAIFMAAFFFYGGLEGGVGAWEATHLVATGLSAATAATITALFWSAFTAGRLIAAPLSLVIRPERLVLACLAAVTVAMLLARIEAITAVAYTVGGLALAPIFPLSLVWSGRAMRVSQRLASFVISGDLLGGVFLSAAIGRLITAASAEAIPFAFAALSAGTLCLLTAVHVLGRNHLAPAA